MQPSVQNREYCQKKTKKRPKMYILFWSSVPPILLKLKRKSNFARKWEHILANKRDFSNSSWMPWQYSIFETRMLAWNDWTLNLGFRPMQQLQLIIRIDPREKKTVGDLAYEQHGELCGLRRLRPYGEPLV